MPDLVEEQFVGQDCGVAKQTEAAGPTIMNRDVGWHEADVREVLKDKR